MSNPFSSDLESESTKARPSSAAIARTVEHSFSEHGNRVPPQQMVISTPKPSSASPHPPNAASEKSNLINKNSGLLYTNSAAQPARRYVVYGDTDDEMDDTYPGRRKPKIQRLINFWASLLAQSFSIPLVGLSIYILVSSLLTSGLVISCTIGITLGMISLIVEICHCLPQCCPKALQWQLGRHAILHASISCFFVLPYMQSQKLLGLLFVLHIIPASLFYTARARRESIPGKV